MNRNPWLKQQEPAFWFLIVFGVGFQIFMQAFYFSNKGDVYTQNFDAMMILREASDSIGGFFRLLLFDRPDKGTVMPLLEIPFFALGMSPVFLNRLWPVLFAVIFLTSTYQLFRLRIGPWSSAVGTLALMNSELVFKNLNELERFGVFVSFFPAAFLFWYRSKDELKNFTMNSGLLVLSIFMCIGSRPFEAFLLVLGLFIFYPRVILSRKLMVGFLLGVLWWAIDPTLIPAWWGASQLQLPFVTGEAWAPERIFSPITSVTVFLFLTTAGHLFINKNWKWDPPTPGLLLGSGLLIAFLFYKRMTVDDYLMLAYLPIMFVVLRFILDYEKSSRFRFRTGILILMIVLFHYDQSFAILNGIAPRDWGRSVGRLDRIFENEWQKMRPFFPENQKSRVGLSFFYYRPVDRDVRQVWGILQTFAFRDHLNVEFDFPDDYILADPTSLPDVCTRKFTHFIFIDPANLPKPEDPIYVLSNHPVLKDIQDALTPLGSFTMDRDEGGDFEKMHLRLFQLNCP